MYPIHPALVHFPLALLTFAVVVDLIGYFQSYEPLVTTSNWAMLGAFVGVVAAAPAGYFDMIGQRLSPGAHEDVHGHMYVGVVLLAAVAGLAAWRWALRAKPNPAAMPVYFAAALLVLGVTFYQGYLGHVLVTEHDVGVAPKHQRTAGETTANADSTGHQGSERSQTGHED